MSIDTKANKFFLDFLPTPESMPNGTYVGTYSYSLPNKTRYIRYTGSVVWEGERDTQAEFTRRFLSELPKRKYRKEQYASFRQSRPPLYCFPAKEPACAYVDICAAFPSLYGLLGWGVDYARDKYLVPGDAPLIYPYPRAWKLGRSYVVSGARPLQFSRRIWNGKIVSKPRMSAYANPSLVASVYDALSAIGRMAVYSFGACYWNVDGAIMPARNADTFSEVLSELGLQTSIKARGDAIILSAGYWLVGSKSTVRWKAHQKTGFSKSGDRIPLSAPQAEDVYWKLKRISDQRKLV